MDAFEIHPPTESRRQEAAVGVGKALDWIHLALDKLGRERVINIKGTKDYQPRPSAPVFSQFPISTGITIVIRDSGSNGEQPSDDDSDAEDHLNYEDRDVDHLTLGMQNIIL